MVDYRKRPQQPQQWPQPQGRWAPPTPPQWGEMAGAARDVARKVAPDVDLDRLARKRPPRRQRRWTGRRILITITVGLVAVIGGCTVAVSLADRAPTLSSRQVPNLVGMSLPDAKDQAGQAGFVPVWWDATGQQRAQVYESHWTVTRQDPPAGTRVHSTRMTLYVDKIPAAATSPGP